MKYEIILADPPWSYRNYGYAKTKSGNIAKRGCRKEYPTMTIKQIQELPIPYICAKNCYLFLWATGPLMDDCISVVKAWGFDYYGIAFTWIKTNKRKTNTLFWGMGNVTRSNPEYVLLGRKGKLDRQSASVHSVVMVPIGQHSRKPNEVSDRIVKLFPNSSKIELFARERIEGWDSIGYDIDGKDIRDSLLEIGRE